VLIGRDEAINNMTIAEILANFTPVPRLATKKQLVNAREVASKGQD